MARLCLPIRGLLLALAAITAHAQSPASGALKAKPKQAQPALLPNLVLLDPAHGGPDNGTTLAADSLEKDATVAFAGRLRTALTAHGFTVVLTHDSAADQPTLDQRAELANHSRAATCLVIHMSNGGHGVHLFTSSLTPVSPLSSVFESTPTVLRWDTAQASSLQQSLGLTFELSDAIHAIRIPLVVGHVSVPPIDSMTCPAVVLELAPLESPDAATPASDGAYQQRIADAVAAALTSWRTKLTAQSSAGAPATTPVTKPAPPAPVRKPRPAVIPIETPDIVPVPVPDPVPAKPAPKAVPQ